MSRDWGKFKLNVQFQLGACQMVNIHNVLTTTSHERSLGATCHILQICVDM